MKRRKRSVQQFEFQGFINVYWYQLFKMMLREISIVFLFLVLLRFPSNLSKIQAVRKRYGNDTVKLVRPFETIDYKYHRLPMDLNFLESCVKNSIKPSFVPFCLAEKDLLDLPAYRQCRQKLLKQKIINKKRYVRLTEKDLSLVKNEFMFKLNWIDFHHVCNLSLVGNDKSRLEYL